MSMIVSPLALHLSLLRVRWALRYMLKVQLKIMSLRLYTGRLVSGACEIGIVRRRPQDRRHRRRLREQVHQQRGGAPMVRSRRSARASLVPPRSRAPTVGESLLEQRTGGVGMLASGAPSIDVPPSIDGSTHC